MSDAVAFPIAVGTGVVVIAVAIAVVLVVLFVTVSMRGRQKRRQEGRRDLGQAHERAARAEQERDIAQQQPPQHPDPPR